MDILNILNQFNIEGKVTEYKPWGNGHINRTFAVFVENNKQPSYILQTVNTNIFGTPEQIMDNIEKVTKHLKAKVSDSRKILSVIPAKDGKSYYIDGENLFWRMFTFVSDSVSLEPPIDKEKFYECGVAFGNFQYLLSDFPADTLYETIPDFHNTPKRYEALLKAIDEDLLGRAKSVKAEIDFAKERKDFYSLLIDSNKSGKLPLRVTHNDTKSNNVMLDAKTYKAVCVIDLDTIMPGFSVNDFGDSIRFGASTAAEDEKDLNLVNFDIELFKIYVDGFLKGCNGQLTNEEIMLLPEGAKMMTIECGIRFLTDYLNGDKYFKTSYSEHNLDRCHTQFKLVADMESKWHEMKEIVAKYIKE